MCPKKNKIIIKEIITDTIQDEKIPYAPRDTNKNGNNSFRILTIRFFTKTNLDCLNAIKAEAIKPEKRSKIINIMKNAPNRKLSFSSINFGNRFSTFKTKIRLNMKAVIPATEKQELIISFLFFSLGRYLINVMSKPRRESVTNKPAEANKVEAIPTCSGENNLVFMAQKKNPRAVIITEFAISHMLLVYR